MHTSKVILQNLFESVVMTAQWSLVCDMHCEDLKCDNSISFKDSEVVLAVM